MINREVKEESYSGKKNGVSEVEVNSSRREILGQSSCAERDFINSKKLSERFREIKLRPKGFIINMLEVEYHQKYGPLDSRKIMIGVKLSK